MGIIYRFFKILIFAKLKFSLPSKKDVLIYDPLINSSNDLLYYLDNSKIERLYIRGEKIYIFILIKSLFSLNFEFKRNYIINYINIVQPKFIISATDNDMVIYTLKEKFLDKIKFIVMQNGLRGIYDSFEEFRIFKKKTKYKLSVDYFLTISEPISKKYKKYIKAKYISIGLFKNNLIKKNKIKYKNRLIFISSFSKNIYENNFYINNHKYINGNLFFKTDEIVLKFLYKYCKQKNIDFYICLRPGNYHEQKKLILDIYPSFKNLKFLSNSNTYDNYREIDKSNFVTCVDSALGYEAYVRGAKVAFFSLKAKSLSINSLKLGWPAKLKKADFWTLENKEKEFEKILNYLVNKNKNYRDYRLKYKNRLMSYDPGNSIFINLLKNNNFPINKKIKNKKRFQI